MGSHPVNLGLRFLLELVALASMGTWGWRSGEGGIRFLLAAILPLTAAAVWGVFAVPDDPSRSGSVPVAVSGLIRLALEALVLGFGVWSLNGSGFTRTSWAFGCVVAIHYAVSYDRIIWLIRQ